MKKNYKTFYSVTYSGFGFFCTRTAWFDNKNDAYEFAKQDYADNPIRHTYRDPEKIAEHEKYVEFYKKS